MHLREFILLKKRSVVFKLLLGLSSATLIIIFLCLPVKAATANVFSDPTVYHNGYAQAGELLCVQSDTAATVQEPASEKLKKVKKKSKTSVKQGSTQAKPESGIEDEDDNDNDMYVPYEKWRMDAFDNWGTRKKKKSVSTETNGEVPDSSKTDDRKKEFNDKEKESMLMYYSSIRMV